MNPGYIFEIKYADPVEQSFTTHFHTILMTVSIFEWMSLNKLRIIQILSMLNFTLELKIQRKSTIH